MITNHTVYRSPIDQTVFKIVFGQDVLRVKESLSFVFVRIRNSSKIKKKNRSNEIEMKLQRFALVN